MARFDWEKANRREKLEPRRRNRHGSKVRARARAQGAREEFVSRHGIACFKSGAKTASWAATGARAHNTAADCTGARGSFPGRGPRPHARGLGRSSAPRHTPQAASTAPAWGRVNLKEGVGEVCALKRAREKSVAGWGRRSPLGVSPKSKVFPSLNAPSGVASDRHRKMPRPSS